MQERNRMQLEDDIQRLYNRIQYDRSLNAAQKSEMAFIMSQLEGELKNLD